jgi:hypothetical protein
MGEPVDAKTLDDQQAQLDGMFSRFAGLLAEWETRVEEGRIGRDRLLSDAARLEEIRSGLRHASEELARMSVAK